MQNLKFDVLLDKQALYLVIIYDGTNIWFNDCWNKRWIANIKFFMSYNISGRLKEVLECPDIIKVFHDCRNDSGVLNSQHGILLQNIFDTQVIISDFFPIPSKPDHKNLGIL